MKNPESGIIHGGKATPYFKLERETRQEDPIPTHMFIIALEIVFSLINANPDIEGLQSSSYGFLYSAYTDGTTFFLRSEGSATEVIKMFDNFFF